jgi:probable rRNA maturation factor
MKLTVNNHSDYSVKKQEVENFCRRLAGENGIDLPQEISVVFVDDETIARLNEKYYNRSGITDVLAFDYGEELAEIILNPSQHQRQAKQFDNSFSEEVAENIIHAFLHLSGYDHTREDDRQLHLKKQKELMEKYKKKPIPELIEIFVPE